MDGFQTTCRGLSVVVQFKRALFLAVHVLICDNSNYDSVIEDCCSLVKQSHSADLEWYLIESNHCITRVLLLLEKRKYLRYHCLSFQRWLM